MFFINKLASVILMIVLTVCLTSTVLASRPSPEFKPFYVYFDNQNQLVVKGKWFNWSENDAVVNSLKLNVTIWGNMGMNTHTLSYNNLEIKMNHDEMIKGTYTSKYVPFQRIDNWAVDSDSSSTILNR